MYREVSPHMDLAEQPWWKHVVATAAKPEATPLAKDAIALLDGLVVQDAARINDVLERRMNDISFPIPKPLMAVAGAIALEIEGAGAAERRAYLEQHMKRRWWAGETELDTNERTAYRVIQAYVARP